MTRSWQFAAGGMLAIAVLRGTPVPARLRSALGRRWDCSRSRLRCCSITSTCRYPGVAAGLLPTIGTLLLLACGLGNDRAPLVRLLASRPAVAIGVLSYSWYLWHWPLTELMRTLPIGQESIWKDVASSSVALLLSIPTYLLLERPMKTLRRPEITRPLRRPHRRRGRRRLGADRGAGAAAGAQPRLRTHPAGDRDRARRPRA